MAELRYSHSALKFLIERTIESGSKERYRGENVLFGNFLSMQITYFNLEAKLKMLLARGGQYYDTLMEHMKHREEFANMMQGQANGDQFFVFYRRSGSRLRGKFNQVQHNYGEYIGIPFVEVRVPFTRNADGTLVFQMVGEKAEDVNHKHSKRFMVLRTGDVVEMVNPPSRRDRHVVTVKDDGEKFPTLSALIEDRERSLDTVLIPHIRGDIVLGTRIYSNPKHHADYASLFGVRDMTAVSSDNRVRYAYNEVEEDSKLDAEEEEYRKRKEKERRRREEEERRKRREEEERRKRKEEEERRKRRLEEQSSRSQERDRSYVGQEEYMKRKEKERKRREEEERKNRREEEEASRAQERERVYVGHEEMVVHHRNRPAYEPQYETVDSFSRLEEERRKRREEEAASRAQGRDRGYVGHEEMVVHHRNRPANEPQYETFDSYSRLEEERRNRREEEEASRAQERDRGYVGHEEMVGHHRNRPAYEPEYDTYDSLN